MNCINGEGRGRWGKTPGWIEGYPLPKLKQCRLIKRVKVSKVSLHQDLLIFADHPAHRYTLHYLQLRWIIQKTPTRKRLRAVLPFNENQRRGNERRFRPRSVADDDERYGHLEEPLGWGYTETKPHDAQGVWLGDSATRDIEQCGGSILGA